MFYPAGIYLCSFRINTCCDEGSVYARNTIIERVTGIKVKESTVQNPNLDPGTIGKKRIILDVHVKDEKGRFF